MRRRCPPYRWFHESRYARHVTAYGGALALATFRPFIGFS
jgi:hypothetical protein